MLKIISHIENRKEKGIGVLSVNKNMLQVIIEEIYIVDNEDKNNNIVLNVYKENEDQYSIYVEDEEEYKKQFDDIDEAITCLDYNIALAQGNEAEAMNILLTQVYEAMIKENEKK